MEGHCLWREGIALLEGGALPLELHVVLCSFGKEG